ncbi:MAG: DUF5050 domain-containing protein [Clostridia bacterium]|nr:DUF5050 domain-containing protein [Clostridia bacterium]
MKIDLSCPVENRGVTVKTNSTSGEPYALCKLFNLSDKVVMGVRLLVHAYDAYGKELTAIEVSLEGLSGQPKSPFAVNKGISLADAPEAKHVTVDICEVAFEDGEVYTASEENMTEVVTMQPEYDEITRLKGVAGEDALCYAADPGPYWMCVCARANKNEDASCIRCGRDKSYVLSHFASHDQINKAEEALRLEAERAEMERLAELERLRQIKKKKLIKRLSISGIAVAALLVLALVGWLIYGAVIGNQAAGKAAEGNYIEAYNMYKQIGSDDIKKVSEKVKGNSFLNMLQTGLLTADEEYFYYISDPMLGTISKENKETGEVTALGEATGVQLSISGEWLYFIDMDTGLLSRVKTDGSVIEGVTDEQISFYMTIGTDMYYLKVEQAAQTGEEQTVTQKMTLWKMDLTSKQSVKVSDAQMGMMELYGGKIYYTNAEDDSKLYVMNHDGKGARKLLDVPVGCFAIAEDTIYYIDATTEDETSMPKLPLVSATLDGKVKEAVVEDQQVGMVGADGKNIYYTTYTDGKLHVMDLETKAVIDVDTSNAMVYNIMDGYMVTADITGNMTKAKFDGSDSKAIYVYEAPSAE